MLFPLLVFVSVWGTHAGSVWPQPELQTFAGDLLCFEYGQLRLSVSINNSDGHIPDVLKDGLERFEDLIFKTPAYKPFVGGHVASKKKARCPYKPVETLSIQVASNDATLNELTDESYELDITSPGATLVAQTVYGALYGLQTFAQLVDRIDLVAADEEGDDEDQSILGDNQLVQLGHRSTYGRRYSGHRYLGGGLQSKSKSLFLINATYISDAPRFSHRGLLIDTARHYLPIKLIKAHIDAMSWSKLNVLHWHIVDDQSFPYQSKALPLLWEGGAYSPKHTYSLKHIKKVVKYAAKRGVRVIPEFDTPGHTQSWGKAYPDLLPDCYNAQGVPSGQKGPIDPTRNETYELLGVLLKEVAGVFPDAYLHLGGDEVSLDCWEGNPIISRWMAANNISDVEALEELYLSKVLDLTKSVGKTAVVWQEVLDNGVALDEDTVVHVWKWWSDLASGLDEEAAGLIGDALDASSADSSTATRRALRAASLLTGASTSSYSSLSEMPPLSETGEEAWRAELNRVTAAGFRALLSAPWYLNLGGLTEDDWVKFYQAEPLAFNGTEEQFSLVLGGEACVWGERVDGTNSLQRTWPRAAAVAERLWSSVEVRDVDDARYRLQEHRCRMLAWGVAAQPIGPGFCPSDYNIKWKIDD